MPVTAVSPPEAAPQKRFGAGAIAGFVAIGAVVGLAVAGGVYFMTPSPQQTTALPNTSAQTASPVESSAPASPTPAVASSASSTPADTPTPATTTTGAAPAPAETSASQPANEPQTPAATAAKTAASVNAAPKAPGEGAGGKCTGDQLSVEVEFMQSRLKSTSASYLITVVNTSSTICSVKGFPGVDLARNGRQVGPDGERFRDETPEMVTLKPGYAAASVVDVTFGVPACEPKPGAQLQVIPPDTTKHHYFDVNAYACTKGAEPQVRIHPLGPRWD